MSSNSAQKKTNWTLALQVQEYVANITGETLMIGLAPAIANAIFDATGVRLRSMPLAPNGVKKT